MFCCKCWVCWRHCFCSDSFEWLPQFLVFPRAHPKTYGGKCLLVQSDVTPLCVGDWKCLCGSESLLCALHVAQGQWVGPHKASIKSCTFSWSSSTGNGRAGGLPVSLVCQQSSAQVSPSPGDCHQPWHVCSNPLTVTGNEPCLLQDAWEALCGFLFPPLSRNIWYPNAMCQVELYTSELRVLLIILYSVDCLLDVPKIRGQPCWRLNTRLLLLMQRILVMFWHPVILLFICKKSRQQLCIAEKFSQKRLMLRKAADTSLIKTTWKLTWIYARDSCLHNKYHSFLIATLTSYPNCCLFWDGIQDLLQSQ